MQSIAFMDRHSAKRAATALRAPDVAGDRVSMLADIVEAPSELEAPKAIMLIRSFGRAQTETWTALPCERFRGLIPGSLGSVVLAA
jgi:hypothetical protein